MFRVKICGITTAADGRLAADAGADAIGLNFYEQSPRFLTAQAAGEIVRALPAHARRIGVFVNASPEAIRAAVQQFGLHAVQLHGDEPPEMLRELRPLVILRAFRVSDSLEPVAAYLEACHRLQAVPRMLLVDAHQGSQYGGTGVAADWSLLARERQRLGGVPLVLAGGLTAANVAEAIGTVRPWAVDVASGVEASPGRKSPDLARAFVAASREAFSAVSRR